MKYKIQIASMIAAALSFAAFSYSAAADDALLTMTAQHDAQVFPYTKLEVVLTITNVSDEGVMIDAPPYEKYMRLRMKTDEDELLYHGQAHVSGRPLGEILTSPYLLDPGRNRSMRIELILAHPDGLKFPDTESPSLNRPIFRDPGEYLLQFEYEVGCRYEQAGQSKRMALTLKSEVSRIHVLDVEQHQDALRALNEMRHSRALIYPLTVPLRDFQEIRDELESFISNHRDSPWAADAYLALGLLYERRWIASRRSEDKELDQSLVMFKRAIALAESLDIPRVREEILGMDNYPRIDELRKWTDLRALRRKWSAPAFVLVFLVCAGLLCIAYARRMRKWTVKTK